MNQITQQVLSDIESITMNLESISNQGLSIIDSFSPITTGIDIATTIIGTLFGGWLTIQLFKKQEKMRIRQEFILNFYKEYKLIYEEILKEIENACHIKDEILTIENTRHVTKKLGYYYTYLSDTPGIEIILEVDDLLIPKILKSIDVLIIKNSELKYLFLCNTKIVENINKHIEINYLILKMEKAIKFLTAFYDCFKKKDENFERNIKYIFDALEDFRKILIELNSIIEESCIGKYFNRSFNIK